MTLKTPTQNFDYEFRTSRRARRLRIAVYCDSRIVVTAPWGFGQNSAEGFLRAKIAWVLEKLEYFKTYQRTLLPKSSKSKYLKYKDRALSLAKERAQYINRFYGFSYNRINIKNQKTRWGSCSKRGNLNFNYKIVFLPIGLVDYLVAHELCHLREFNHSRRFWDLVSLAAPNYQQLSRELKRQL